MLDLRKTKAVMRKQLDLDLTKRTKSVKRTMSPPVPPKDFPCSCGGLWSTPQHPEGFLEDEVEYNRDRRHWPHVFGLNGAYQVDVMQRICHNSWLKKRLNRAVRRVRDQTVPASDVEAAHFRGSEYSAACEELREVEAEVNAVPGLSDHLQGGTNASAGCDLQDEAAQSNGCILYWTGREHCVHRQTYETSIHHELVHFTWSILSSIGSAGFESIHKVLTDIYKGQKSDVNFLHLNGFHDAFWACLSRQDEHFQDSPCPTCPRMWVPTPGGGREMVSAHNFPF